MAELKDIFNSISKKTGWDLISDDDKSRLFFIVNRYMSKKYPQKSQLFNLKTIDKVSAMNLWYNFMLTQPYPNWFWSKDKQEKTEISIKDYKLLLNNLKIKDIDLDYLILKYPEFINDELKYFREIEKNK
jgi:hypothetical protein